VPGTTPPMRFPAHSGGAGARAGKLATTPRRARTPTIHRRSLVDSGAEYGHAANPARESSLAGSSGGNGGRDTVNLPTLRDQGRRAVGGFVGALQAFGQVGDLVA